MMTAIAQEEAKLEAMQRVWTSNRRGTSMSLFEDDMERELFALSRQIRRGTSASLYDDDVDSELFSLSRQGSCSAIIPRGQCASPPPSFACIEIDNEPEIIEVQEIKPVLETVESEHETCTLDAAELGDLPARYVITPVDSHQFPVVGVYIDKRVIPGFKYRVRPLAGINDNRSYSCLFGERALTLQSIGRGYARRFTFEADHNCLNDNENYFWSDNRPEGYAFELEVVSEGDKFTIFDANREAQGTLEVLKIESPQVETATNFKTDAVEKRVRVRLTGKVEFYETGVAKPMPLSGIAICTKRKGSPRAEITRIINISIKHHRYFLTPGIQKVHRRVTVKGQDINDVPTRYTMTGLESYEIPVVGTYVDPRIIPGFHYRVRPNDRKDHLFDGRALKLVSIGMGYAKRLTFQPDSLVNPDNYLWSDNHPDGLGLEPRAVHTGMKFSVMANDQKLGEASVFRADLPQKEEHMEKVLTSSGKYAIEKHIQVDVMCHVKLAITGGGSADNEEHLMRVCGLAVLRKEPRSNDSYIVRVENVGLDSQLNLIFAHNHTELTFVPIVQN